VGLCFLFFVFVFGEMNERLAALGLRCVKINMPDAVAQSILGTSGAFRVPASHWPSYARSQQDRTAMDDEHDDDDEGDTDEGEQYETFPEFERVVGDAIARLGGCVFPKCNWSSPKDAAWMTPDGSLRCTTAAEVLLLLRSSDFAVADIEQARAARVQPAVVLKEWAEISPASEFRCFVVRGSGGGSAAAGEKELRLAAICQRNLSEYYPHLKEVRTSLRDTVASFVARDVVPLVAPDGDWVVDLYIDQGGSVRLLDVEALDQEFLESNPSLITWQELAALRVSSQCSLRIVEHDRGVQPSSRNLCGVPTELRDVTAEDLSELLNSMERDRCKERDSSK
jgi:hypothetical protein